MDEENRHESFTCFREWFLSFFYLPQGCARCRYSLRRYWHSSHGWSKWYSVWITFILNGLFFTVRRPSSNPSPRVTEEKVLSDEDTFSPRPGCNLPFFVVAACQARPHNNKARKLFLPNPPLGETTGHKQTKVSRDEGWDGGRGGGGGVF